MCLTQSTLVRSMAFSITVCAGSVSAHAGIQASFDLDGDGAFDSYAESDYSQDWFGKATYTRDVWNGDVGSGYSFVWSGAGNKGRVPKATDTTWGHWPWSQTSYLSMAEKRGSITWTNSTTGEETEGGANYYDAVVSGIVYYVGDLVGLVKGGSGSKSLFDGLEFRSDLDGGYISNTVTNLSSAPIMVPFDWSAVGMSGELGPGQSLTRIRPAPDGAVERKSLVSHGLYVEGMGLVAAQSQFHYWQPVPAPGSLGLAGLAGMVASRRRR